jgi:DNA repair protein RecO (recombination protein O)
MLHSTKGIVLRSIKYGDTSIIVYIYTAVFGLQSYLVNGVRTDKKSSTKANIYQSATLLDLIVYHHPNKNLQRIKEARVYYLYQHVQRSIVKNAIAIYMAELIAKTITEPESNIELFDFFDDCFKHVDQEEDSALADFPIQFTIELSDRLGFGMQRKDHEADLFFDLSLGKFVPHIPMTHSTFIDEPTSEILATYIDSSLHDSIQLNHVQRKNILAHCIQYLRLHIPHMSELKSPEVLHAVLS